MSSVTQIIESLKSTIDAKFKQQVMIGEVATIKVTSTMTFLLMKDPDVAINAVCFQPLKHVNNGDKITVSGKLTVYPKTGCCQFVITTAEVLGVGVEHQKQRNMIDQLERDGIFDQKRELPKYISRIAILTSLDGAVIKDMLAVLHNFNGIIYVKGCQVQGINCPSSVASGVSFFNNSNLQYDVLVLARGGGSTEDLSGYSTLEVINAIYSSNKPTISAIGHETDHMLSDRVADVRAPTPSVAAEIIMKTQNEMNTRICDLDLKLDNIAKHMHKQINAYVNSLQRIEEMIECANPIQNIDKHLLSLDNMLINITIHVNTCLEKEITRLHNIQIDTRSRIIADNCLITTKKEWLQHHKKSILLSFPDGDVVVEL